MHGPPMRQILGWTEKDDTGRTFDVEASRERNVWSLKRRANRRDEWEPLPSPSVAQWEALVDLLQRKYTRRRCAWRDVEQALACLENARQQLPNT